MANLSCNCSHGRLTVHERGVVVFAAIGVPLWFLSIGRDAAPAVCGAQHLPRVALFTALTPRTQRINNSASRGLRAAQKRWNLRAHVTALAVAAEQCRSWFFASPYRRQHR